MIEISIGIYPKTMNTCTMVPQKTLVIDFSKDNMEVFYTKLFENRTKKNKSYIDKYSSIKELEEDIYGRCYFGLQFNYGGTQFKYIYKQLDKNTFLAKINDMISQYGNMMVLDGTNLCVRSDEPLRLLDCIKDFLNNPEDTKWTIVKK